MRRCASRLTVIALMTAAMGSQPAHAQLGGGGSGTNNAPPPEKTAVSPGGVDMRTGHYAYEATDLTIGAGNPGDLSLLLSLRLPDQEAVEELVIPAAWVAPIDIALRDFKARHKDWRCYEIHV